MTHRIITSALEPTTAPHTSGSASLGPTILGLAPSHNYLFSQEHTDAENKDSTNRQRQRWKGLCVTFYQLVLTPRGYALTPYITIYDNMLEVNLHDTNAKRQLQHSR
jgi:hypothetical protein